MYARGRVDRFESAQTLYQRSVDIKRSASGLFNLGVTHYHLSELSSVTALSLVLSYWGLSMKVLMRNAVARGIRPGHLVLEGLDSTPTFEP